MKFIRSAIVFLMVNYSAVLFCQEPVFTREFESLRGNVPMKIINPDGPFFYLLRYNKLIHDLIVEKRSKASGNIVRLTPLKLDSVNANWFDYDNLDYLFFKSGDKLCFAFEKVLNTKRSIFVNTIDSSGRASRLRELVALERTQAIENTRFIFKKTTAERLLIVSQEYLKNTGIRKTALLFDPPSGQTVAAYKLPLENELTGHAVFFECDKSGNLYFLQQYTQVLGYRRIYIDRNQINVAVRSTDSLFAGGITQQEELLARKKINLPDSTGIENAELRVQHDSLLIGLHEKEFYGGQEGRMGFSSYLLDTKLTSVKSSRRYSLSEEATKQFIFYDGSDDNTPASRDYKSVARYRSGNKLWMLAGREDENYSKELVVWNVDIGDAAIGAPAILPRKLFFFTKRSRFKNIGGVQCLATSSALCCYLLENPQNSGIMPAKFDFHQFNMQRNAAGANFVEYRFGNDGNVSKRVVYTNRDFEVIPVLYESSTPQLLFYLTNGKKERFAILSPE